MAQGWRKEGGVQVTSRLNKCDLMLWQRADMTCFIGDHQSKFEINPPPPTAQQIHHLLGHRNAPCYVIFSHETLCFTVMSQDRSQVRGGESRNAGTDTPNTLKETSTRIPLWIQRSVILARATIRFNVKVTSNPENGNSATIFLTQC